MLSLLISLLLAFLVGWVSQRMGMCLVNAMGLLLKRRPTLFVSLVSCGLFGLLLALYTFEPQWTPSVFFYDLSQMFWLPGENMLTQQRVAVFSLLLGGMLSYTLHRRTFNYQRFEAMTAGRHLLAGVLMGTGASMMLGGNDSQILLVFPTLTWVGAVPLVSIVLGILVGVWVRRVSRAYSQ
ncbi:YeeE/YedE thiosulfate transporter family protein [Pseudomonas synxantha]|uniref:Uncharacterized protein n=1 Tax=Pseudomonas synxantha TaxID=47883 RepID=A0ACC6JKU8_9PSED|nr:YeeE/YedE thiosulfate transporter family protein [Pseudomonas synxantha]MDR6607018.1 hypothetical protein [Pseudomonas synxantha]